MRLIALILLPIGGAWAQNVTAEFDPAVAFSRYKTFSIRDGVLNSKNPALNSELVKKRIESDIEPDLTAHGLTRTSERGDLNVRYTFGSNAFFTILSSFPCTSLALRLSSRAMPRHTSELHSAVTETRYEARADATGAYRFSLPPGSLSGRVRAATLRQRSWLNASEVPVLEAGDAAAPVECAYRLRSSAPSTGALVDWTTISAAEHDDVVRLPLGHESRNQKVNLICDSSRRLLAVS
jgi:hypothetical protein